MMLSAYRVLDLTDGKGLVCGKILADLGADVIKIEKPGGDSTRNTGPFYHDESHPEKSLYWFAYNLNKRGITLDIATNEGRSIFKELVRKADFIIESYNPGYMQSLGLGYESLEEINPRIILTSITPFGQSGPYADYKASDITCLALSGYLFMTGDPDRPPVCISMPQAALHAGAEAAAASMIAHWHRERTGEGQHIDVSIQESCVGLLRPALLSEDLAHIHATRVGGRHKTARAQLSLVFPCKDGFVVMTLMGGGAPVQSNSCRNLALWMDEEGQCPEWLRDLDWVNDYDTVGVTQELVDKVEESVKSFLMTKTKQELYDASLKKGILVAPVNTITDILADPQLAARGFWANIKHPELNDSITYPGPFLKLSATPIKITRRAPLIGEHNKDIYEKELGFSKEQIILLKEQKVI